MSHLKFLQVRFIQIFIYLAIILYFFWRDYFLRFVLAGLMRPAFDVAVVAAFLTLSLLLWNDVLQAEMKL